VFLRWSSKCLLFVLGHDEGAAELRAEGPSAPAACSPAAGEEHAALRCALVPPGLRSGGTLYIEPIQLFSPGSVSIHSTGLRKIVNIY
jgi:hypothetical protein